MFVVPVARDKIRTKDDSNPRVVTSYTSLKDEPAVYLDPSTSQDKFLFFSDIVEINGVKVEYDTESKTFNALGPLKRKFNLPQPKDTIKINLIDTPFKSEDEEVEVTAIRLHSKKYGPERGLLICSKNSNFNLNEILNIERRSWTEKFDKALFRKYYRDYLPIGKGK